MYKPKHALIGIKEAVEKLSAKARVISVVTIAAGATALGATVLPSAGSAAVSYITPSGGGVVTEIVLANGGYSKCLNDWGQNVSAGAAIRLYTCVNASANQWVTYPDNTLRPYLDTSMALTVAGSGAVLEPATGASDQVWYYRDDGALVNGTGAGTSFTEPLLNDPGYNASNGVQLIDYNQTWATDNAHWWVTNARFAGSTLSNRPDSGGNGNWANDHISRGSVVLYMGDTVAGHNYQGSVYDSPASFHALAGAYTPNQGITKGATIKDSIGGSMVGSTGYLFTSSSFVTQFPASAYSGGSPATSTWYQLFFPAGKTGGTGELGAGPVGWGWQYTSATDACSHTETWIDADWNSGGQAATAGNIDGGASC
jgi:hypothetical protein